MNIKDKVVIITGGSKGIGKATASHFVKEGAKVVIVARNQKDIVAAVRELGKESALGIVADVRHKDEVERMVSKTMKTFRKIDILINNAGVFHPGNFLKQQDEPWHEEVDTNIKGVFNCTQVIAPYMVKQRDGIIINISSEAGKAGSAGYATYSATKFAVLGFTQGFSEEVAPYNVRVYAVCPGMTKTQMTGFAGMPSSKVAKRIADVAKETLGLSPGEDTEIYY